MVAALLSELGGAFETNGNIEEAERMYTTAVALVRGHRARCGLSTVLSVADPYVVMIRIAYYSVVLREVPHAGSYLQLQPKANKQTH